MRRPISLLCVLAVLACALPARAEKVKACFALLETVGDMGWSRSHHDGIEYVKAELGGQVETVYAENVKAADAERVFRQFAQDGCKVVFGTTFEHMDPMLAVAADYPKVVFEHCAGYKTAPNMGTYMARIEQAEYLAGYLAGLMGYKNVGTAATVPIPEPIRGVNAFTLGLDLGLAESGIKYDPAKINTVAWLNAWRDPQAETTLAETLAGRGHDLIRQMADTPDSSLAACAKGVPAVGYGTDAAGFGAKCALVSTLWNWGPLYVKIIRTVLDGTWKPAEYFEGFASDAVGLSAFDDRVPQAVRDKVAAKLADMKAGRDDSFLGPVVAQDGAVMIPAGTRASDKDLLTMRWFVRGVSGTIPK
jgi:basic membrane protein A and related proteins